MATKPAAKKTSGVALRLTLRNVYGEPLRQDVDIALRNRRLTDNRRLKGVSTAGPVRITGLRPFPNGLYEVHVDPPSYLPVGHFVSLGASGDTNHEMVFPVDPVKVVRLDADAFSTLHPDTQKILVASKQVLGYENFSGKALYDRLDDIRKAGLLNIVCKCENTALPNGRLVLSYLREIIELRGDRLFAKVPHELREEVKNSVATGLFEPAPDEMHHPPFGYSRAGSFKTDDRYGNLQLTFFSDGTNWLADIDIDDAKGLEHVFQVLRNHLRDRPTHPYDIHQILVFHQHLRPNYRPVV